MDGFDDRAFIEAYKRLATGTPHPGDREIVQSVRDIEAARGSDTAALDAVLGTDWGSQASALTPSTLPSVAEQVATSMGMGVPASDPAVDWMQQQPGSTPPPTGSTSSPLDAIGAFMSGAGTTIDSMPDPVGAVLPNIPGLSATGKALLSGQEIPATSGPGDDLRAEAAPGPSGVRVSPDAGMITPPRDFFGGARAAAIGTDGLPPTANPLPDQGGANDRKGERGGRTNWKVEADELGGLLPGESAFAGIEAGMLPTVEADPRIAANFIARQRGAGDFGGAMIAPQLEQLLDLNTTGIYGGKGVGPGGGLQGPADRLGAAEDLYNQLGPGSYLDPQTLHRKTLRNIRRTDATAMSSGTGEGTAGDINNQIAVTNDALAAAAAASMAPDALAAMEARLHAAEQEYIMGVVDGSIVPSTLSYPQWLRTEKQVRKWVGRGTTPEQWQQAFSTE